MYQATGGVNTHKGMIFSMGIICAAYGYCKEKSGRVQKIIVEEIFDTAKKMTGKILAEELKRLEYQFRRSGRSARPDTTFVADRT